MNVQTIANLTINALADGAAGQPAGGGGAGFLEMFRGPQGLIFLLIIVLWVFVFSTRGSKRKEAEARKAKLAAMKSGDSIQTIGGIRGKVVRVEKDQVLVKVDESSNTKIWFVREAIDKMLDDEKPAAAAADKATPAK